MCMYIYIYIEIQRICLNYFGLNDLSPELDLVLQLLLRSVGRCPSRGSVAVVAHTQERQEHT